jgi:hypothetical protein
LSKFKLQLDLRKVQVFSAKACVKDEVCGSIVDATPSEIFGAVYEDAIFLLSNDEMTNEEYAEMNLELERIYNISQGPLDTDDYQELVYKYYNAIEKRNIA